MRVSIVGCPDWRRFRPYVKRATYFYAEQLISTKMRQNIFLKIKFDQHLEEFGYASVKECNLSNKPREFLIEINSLIGARDILDTLAHEMVHIKQYVYGETNEHLTRWKGQVISDVDYFDHPWEIEAFGMSRGLFTRFVIQEKLWEVFEGIRNPNRSIDPLPIGWIHQEVCEV